jgi:hypothetical protein
MPDFMPGLELSERYFREAVEPLIASHAPDLRYAAGLFGAGSDVLGYDTARSMDHDWGPRLTILLAEEDFDTWQGRLDSLMGDELPATLRGFPTRYARHEADGTAHMAERVDDRQLDHLVTITTAGRWFGGIAGPGIDTTSWVTLPGEWLAGILSWGTKQPETQGRAHSLNAATWVTLPQQSLLEMTSGRIFRDDIGAVTKVRSELAWYPDDVWRYLMAAQWMRIDQIEPFIGRCGEVGDDLGSHIVAMTLTRDVMRMAFLLERKYAPYPKWFGTGFQRLQLAQSLTPHLDRARFARTWQERESGVVGAVQILAERHNTTGLTETVDPAPRMFHSRPFAVMGAARFSEALLETIRDPDVVALPRNIGGIDHYMDSTDALNNGSLHRAIREWMELPKARG